MRLSSATIGRRLAAIRKDRGLTQVELAALIGRSKTAIFAWEAGRYDLKVGDALKCADAMHCRLQDLLAAIDKPIPKAPASWPRTRQRKLQVRAAAPRITAAAT